MSRQDPTAPPRSTHTRHTAASVAQAQRMHEGGWSVYAIAKVLRRQGVSVDETTVAGWVDPKLAERRRREQAQRSRVRLARKSGGRLGAGPPRSPEFRLIRMASLRQLGMPYRDIAKVMTFDFPKEPITEDQARYALRTGEPPRPYRDLVHRTAGAVRRLEIPTVDPDTLRACRDCGGPIDFTALRGRPPVRCDECRDTEAVA